MDIFIVLILVIISIIDIKKKIIHNEASLLTLLIGLLINRTLYFNGLLVSLAILLICVFIDYNYKGGGDIKFIAVIGLLKGFNFTFNFFIIADCLCLIFRKLNKNKLNEIAFSPFMLVSFLINIIG